MSFAGQLPARVLNFVVTGPARCGASVIQSSVHAHPRAVCHGDLLAEDLQTRRQAYHAYFGGTERDAALVRHFCEPEDFLRGDTRCVPGQLVAEQYLTYHIFDRPLRGEIAVGVKILYRDLLRHQLWDYLKGWCRVGDFCVIHVRRNPVACYVSWKQAAASGIWRQDANVRETEDVARPVKGNPEELTEFVRCCGRCEVAVQSACDDRLEIDYKELCLDYRGVMAGVFEFLDLPAFPEVQPAIRRLKNRDIRRRLKNFDELKASVPRELRDCFDNDLF